MKPLVVDASARVDTLRHAKLAGHLFANYDVCAPTLLRWEVGSVVHGRNAAAFGEPKTRDAVVATLLRHVRLVDQAGREAAIAEQVRKHGLTFYDAAYLQLALDEDADLVTHDKQLAEAATKALGGWRVWTLESAARAVKEGGL